MSENLHELDNNEHLHDDVIDENHDHDDVSETQTEQIVQLHEITNLEISQCKELLEGSDWNVQVAVTKFFQPDATSTISSATESRNPETASSTSTASPSRSYRDIFNQVMRLFYINHNGPHGFLYWAKVFVTLPFRFVFTIFSDVFSLLWRFSFTERIEMTDPADDVSHYAEQFERTYGHTHPVFYQGSFAQATRDAMKEVRYLFLYLHDQSSSACDRFCRNTLCNPEVVSFINSNFLFWSCSISFNEGRQVYDAEQVFSCPYFAIYFARNGKPTSVASFYEIFGPEVLKQRLESILRSTEHMVLFERNLKKKLIENTEIRRKQDTAYVRSLKADQKKEKLKQALLEKEKQMQDEAQAKIEEQKKIREFSRQSVKEEPAMNSLDVITLCVKFADGSSVRRRFYKYDALKHLYFYLLSLDVTPFNFEISTNIPKVIIPCTSTEEKTFEDVGIVTPHTLFVVDLDA